MRFDRPNRRPRPCRSRGRRSKMSWGSLVRACTERAPARMLKAVVAIINPPRLRPRIARGPYAGRGVVGFRSSPLTVATHVPRLDWSFMADPSPCHRRVTDSRNQEDHEDTKGHHELGSSRSSAITADARIRQAIYRPHLGPPRARPSRGCGRRYLLATQRGVAGHSDRHHVHRSGGDR